MRTRLGLALTIPIVLLNADVRESFGNTIPDFAASEYLGVGLGSDESSVGDWTWASGGMADAPALGAGAA